MCLSLLNVVFPVLYTLQMAHFFYLLQKISCTIHRMRKADNRDSCEAYSTRLWLVYCYLSTSGLNSNFKGLHQFLTFEKSIFFHISIVYCSKNNFLKWYSRIINKFEMGVYKTRLILDARRRVGAPSSCLLIVVL